VRGLDDVIVDGDHGEEAFRTLGLGEEGDPPRFGEREVASRLQVFE
jgi:hypothetical protein